MGRYESARLIAIMGVQSCVQYKRNNPEQEIAAGFFIVWSQQPTHSHRLAIKQMARTVQENYTR
ncbi:hypothetical protein C660_13664 [Alcaligenes sp. HPC1271]|nr:hypothetical protein C660_13664 [Alcaligenes sp. HPC1271]